MISCLLPVVGGPWPLTHSEAAARASRTASGRPRNTSVVSAVAKQPTGCRDGPCRPFKVYTAWQPGGHGFDLEDPAIGLPVVQHAHDLGVRIMCGHKGLQLLNFESTWNQPRDMVAVSRQFPDMQLVVDASSEIW